MVNDSVANVSASLPFVYTDALRLCLEGDPVIVERELASLNRRISDCLEFLNGQEETHKPRPFMELVRCELRFALKLKHRIDRLTDGYRRMKEKSAL